MDLSTTYLGHELKNPFILGACPLTENVKAVQELEAQGISAVVLRSLFVEQIEDRARGGDPLPERYGSRYEEARSHLPPEPKYALEPDDYLAKVEELKSELEIPVFASINGSAEGSWFQYARMLEEVGADGLELNLYFLAADPEVTGPELEEKLIRVVQNIRSRLRIPLMVKLSPYYSSLANFAVRLDEAGADGLLLFNRFYQPDIDLEDRQVKPTLWLSDSSELPLRLRWCAMLFGRVNCDLAITGGVHTAEDACKSILSGASAVQLVSMVLREGPEAVAKLRESLQTLLEQLDCGTLSEMRGALSHLKSKHAAAIERTNYLRTLNSWK